MASFKVTYKHDDDTDGYGVLTGPKGATVEQCERVANYCASNYGIKPGTFQITPLPKRPGKGFLHPLYARLPDGRESLMENWYF